MLVYLMYFEDKVIVFKMLDLVFIDDIMFVNIMYMVVRVVCNLDDYMLLYEWFSKNKDVLLVKMFDYYVSRMLEFVLIICLVENLEMVNVFYVLISEIY